MFTSQDEVKMIWYLCGDDAQTFINIIDEVRLWARLPLSPVLILLFVSSLVLVVDHSLLTRPWIAPIFRNGFEGSA